MYQNPVLFPQITNRESWPWTLQVYDDDTGDLVSLVDGSGNPLYAITLQVMRGKWNCGPYGGFTPSPWYDEYDGSPIITATLADYIAIVDTGTISVQIPKKLMQTLRPQSYDVYMTLYDATSDDGRQLIVGRLPVVFGGQNT